jgi:hypothetical protein
LITQSQVIGITGVSLAGLVAATYLGRQPSTPLPGSQLPARFTNENITQRFTASLPVIPGG